MQWSDSRDSVDGYIGGSIPPLVKWHMHTSLSRGEHTHTDRAFQLIKECVWVALAVGCMERVGGVGGGAIFFIGDNGSTISACRTVSRIHVWPVFGPSILIGRHTILECIW